MVRKDVFEGLYVDKMKCDTRHIRKGENMPMPNSLHLTETRETKATLTAVSGRVVAWTNDKEPSHISIAIPGDRAKLTAAQALALADWLRRQAEEITSGYQRGAAALDPYRRV